MWVVVVFWRLDSIRSVMDEVGFGRPPRRRLRYRFLGAFLLVRGEASNLERIACGNVAMVACVPKLLAVSLADWLDGTELTLGVSRATGDLSDTVTSYKVLILSVCSLNCSGASWSAGKRFSLLRANSGESHFCLTGGRFSKPAFFICRYF